MKSCLGLGTADEDYIPLVVLDFNINFFIIIIFNCFIILYHIPFSLWTSVFTMIVLVSNVTLDYFPLNSF